MKTTNKPGPRPKGGGTRNQGLSWRADVLEAATLHSRLTGVSLSTYVMQILRKHLERKKIIEPQEDLESIRQEFEQRKVL